MKKVFFNHAYWMIDENLTVLVECMAKGRTVTLNHLTLEDRKTVLKQIF
jgi:hypothetical protein